MSRRSAPRRSREATARRSRGAAPRGRHVAPAPDPAPGAGGAGRIGRTARRLVGPVVLVVLTVGVLMLGAFPTRTLLQQRHTAASAEARLEELEAANAAAREEADALRTDAVVERLARQEYGLAKPGEELYHVLPPARDPVRVPEAWPFTGLGSTIER